MRLPIFQVDAFTGKLFGGNPAAVVVLEDWLDDHLMLHIAAENNLSETAFLVPKKEPNTYELRWFTPKVEIDLCGHATLASAFVLFQENMISGDQVHFETRFSGSLYVTREGDRLCLDFPARDPKPMVLETALVEALGACPKEVFLARDLMAVFEKEAEIRAIRPDFGKLARLDTFAVMVTAPGDEADFVSRFFAPKTGVNEDPVTGSAHCSLIPFWSKRLGKKQLRALQISERQGELFCEDKGERVKIAGCAVAFLRGTIDV